jgi:hypothetical protein
VKGHKQEIVRSGTWLYDDTVRKHVLIVKQNFEPYYEEGYEDGPEKLNHEGFVFVVQWRKVIDEVDGTPYMSLEEAIQGAHAIVKKIEWES